MKDLAAGRIRDGSSIVCTLTGHGLKDPDTAIAQCVKPLTVDAELADIEKIIRQYLPKA
jgi:threonine synthase